MEKTYRFLSYFFAAFLWWSSVVFTKAILANFPTLKMLLSHRECSDSHYRHHAFSCNDVRFVVFATHHTAHFDYQEKNKVS